MEARLGCGAIGVQAGSARRASKPNERPVPARKPELRPAASVLAQKLAGLPVDEMKPGAGETDHRHIGIGFVVRPGRRKPMLHVRADRWTLEKDMTTHTGLNMQKPGGGSLPYGYVAERAGAGARVGTSGRALGLKPGRRQLLGVRGN